MKTPFPLVALVAALAVACSSGAAASSAPPGSATLPPVAVTTPEGAAARVAQGYPAFAGIEPQNPDLIGGCCFWTARQTADGFEVTYEVGWGDCMAGCIDRHNWVFAVSPDGAVVLVTEAGPPVPSGLPGSGIVGGGTGGGILPGGSGIEGVAAAGPTCPVVSIDNPNCADRPLAGATVIILDAAGNEAARVLTDANGHYAVALPAGPYMVEPQPVDGILRTAKTVPVTVGDEFVRVDLGYDTGIR